MECLVWPLLLLQKCNTRGHNQFENQRLGEPSGLFLHWAGAASKQRRSKPATSYVLALGPLRLAAGAGAAAGDSFSC